MKLLTPAMPPWPALCALTLAATLVLPAGAVQTRQATTSACDCDNGLAADMVAFGVSGLLQKDAKLGQGLGKRPRDCTCITGVKTYQTTPRDELLGMGMLALGRHLASCERKLDGLEQQKEYEIAASEVKVKKANEQMSQAMSSLENVKNKTASDRSQDRVERKQLMKEVSTLEKEITKLNDQYNDEFSAWWKLKDSMTAKLKQTKSCKCKKAFLQGAPPSPDMYKTAQKVEECETKVIKVSGDISKAQATGRKATITAIEDRKTFGRSMADQERLNKLLTQKPHLDALSRTKTNLERIVKTRQQKVDGYKATNADIQKSLKQLDDNLKKCGC